MSNLRELILDDIDRMKDIDGFSSDMMRWNRCWFKENEGIKFPLARKDRANMIRLSEVSSTQFARLRDEQLLETYRLLLFTSFKQM